MSLARVAPSGTPRAPSAPVIPATPAAQTDQTYTPNGSWKHPKFDEIARRQYATTFDETNVRAIVANTALLFLSVYGNTILNTFSWLQYPASVRAPYRLCSMLTFRSGSSSTLSSTMCHTANGLQVPLSSYWSSTSSLPSCP